MLEHWFFGILRKSLEQYSICSMPKRPMFYHILLVTCLVILNEKNTLRTEKHGLKIAQKWWNFPTKWHLKKHIAFDWWFWGFCSKKFAYFIYSDALCIFCDVTCDVTLCFLWFWRCNFPLLGSHELVNSSPIVFIVFTSVLLSILSLSWAKLMCNLKNFTCGTREIKISFSISEPLYSWSVTQFDLMLCSSGQAGSQGEEERELTV